MARSTPSLAASVFAASVIFLKYGFVSATTSKATLGPPAEALLEQAKARRSAQEDAAADALLERSHWIVERVMPEFAPGIVRVGSKRRNLIYTVASF